MSPDEWNREDRCFFELFSPVYPPFQGFEGWVPLLDILDSLDVELRPDRMHLKRTLKYSRQVLRQRLHEVTWGNVTSFTLLRSRPPDASFMLSCYEGNEESRFNPELRIKPFSVVKEPGRQDVWAERMVALVRAFAAKMPISFGYVHSYTDLMLTEEPHLGDPVAPMRVHGVYWLNVYGARMVEEMGRQRVLATPAYHVEELPHGAVLVLTRPTPADFDSEEARQAQASALVHLRPELKREEVLARLREQSLAFLPVEKDFDEDVAELLERTLRFVGLSGMRREILRLNQYHPPAPTEWRPASELPPPDVEDVDATVRLYEDVYSEQLYVALYKRVRFEMVRTPERLPDIDEYLWRSDWGGNLTAEEKELLIPSMGAWLGYLLVHVLGGRWVPRRNLDEAAVVVGGRAWLPFLRARHHLRSRQSALDCSLSQLFRQARRLGGLERASM